MKNDKKVLLEEMSRPDIESAIANGTDTVLIMAGAIEQHGPHLPIGTDTILGYEWGKQIAWSLGNALVAPVIRPAISPHHMSFPGTITLPKETFHEVVRAYVDCLIQAGFRNVVLICSHGGNTVAVRELLPELQERYAGKANVIAILDIQCKDKDLNQWLATCGITAKEAGVHSGLSETSCMMDLRPELVHTDRLEPGFMASYDSTELHQKGIKAFSANGILGDATRSSADIGKELNRKTVEFYYEKIKETLREVR